MPRYASRCPDFQESWKNLRKVKKVPFSVKKGPLIRPLIMPFFEKIPGQAEDRAGPRVYSPPREDPLFHFFFEGEFGPNFAFPLEKKSIFRPEISLLLGIGKKVEKFQFFHPFFQKWPFLCSPPRDPKPHPEEESTEIGHFSRKNRFSVKNRPFFHFSCVFAQIWPLQPTDPF